MSIRAFVVQWEWRGDFQCSSSSFPFFFFCFLISLLLPYGCDMSLFWTFIQPSSLDIRELRYGRIFGRRYQKGHCVSVSLPLLFFSLSIYMCVGCATIKKMERKYKRRWSILHLHCPIWRLNPNRRRESELLFRNSSHLVVLLAANWRGDIIEILLCVSTKCSRYIPLCIHSWKANI